MLSLCIPLLTCHGASAEPEGVQYCHTLGGSFESPCAVSQDAGGVSDGS